jgi:acetylcholinesterase
MAESGFGGFISRYPGNFNNTELGQATYNILVTNTSCASTVNTSASLDCLRTLPFAEINAALNGTAAAPWPPVLDGDFIADYPSRQTADGRFVHVPILIGSNSDEGTAFGTGRGPGGGGVNTDAEMAGATAASFGPEAANETGKAVGELVDELLYLYPDIQAVGIPSLQTYPEVILPGSALARLVGAQYRRTGALFGDLCVYRPLAPLPILRP